jgi:hypothetical protein
VIATIESGIKPRTVDDPASTMVPALCDFAGDWPPDEASRARLVWAAVEHGKERRTLGSDETEVFEDYERVRRTLWRGIRQSPSDPGVASELILRIDAAISLAVAASLRGYYQDVIERSGEWPVAVERLLWDWRIRRSDKDIR